MILFAPFRFFNALMLTYSDLNVPQDLLREVARRHAKGVRHFRRIEVGNALKIFLAEVFGGVKPTTRHYGVRYAVSQRFHECCAQRTVVDVI